MQLQKKSQLWEKSETKWLQWECQNCEIWVQLWEIFTIARDNDKCESHTIIRVVATVVVTTVVATVRPHIIIIARNIISYRKYSQSQMWDTVTKLTMLLWQFWDIVAITRNTIVVSSFKCKIN